MPPIIKGKTNAEGSQHIELNSLTLTSKPNLTQYQNWWAWGQQEETKGNEGEESEQDTRWEVEGLWEANQVFAPLRFAQPCLHIGAFSELRWNSTFWKGLVLNG